MYSLFYNLSWFINLISVTAAVLLMVMTLMSLFRATTMPSFEVIVSYIKRSFHTSLIFLLASWLVVSANDNSQIYQMYDNIAKRANGMSMGWFVVAVAYIVFSFILGLMGKKDDELFDDINKMRNSAFIMGALLCIVSFLLSIH